MAACCQISISSRRRTAVKIAYPRHVPGEIKPPDPPMIPFAVVGIVAWAVLGLALLPFRDWLSRHGHMNWFWTCLAGFLWGFVGLAVMIRHDRHRRAHASAPRERSERQ